MTAVNNLTTIYIVRHGQAQANEDKIVAGITDTPLTELGQQQAIERGKEFKSIKFDAVFSSDLLRAHKTAQLIVLEKQLAVNTTKVLRERNFGEWEGRPETEVFKENAHLFEQLQTLSEQEKRDFKFNPTFETDAEIIVRFITFLREIAVTYSGQTILVTCHGSIMRALLFHLGFALFDELPAGTIENTGWVKLESDGVDFFVKETMGVNKVKIN